MTAYVALIRAVNVSGTGKLPKDDLKAIGEACGFDKVRTFINSGNLLFASDLAEATVQERIKERLVAYFGKPTPVFVRSAREMAEAGRQNPFSDDKPSRVMAHFIAENSAQSMIDEARDVVGERMALGPRLIYVSYGEGIGQSKLKLPAVKQGTARNMNSVAKIAELLAGME
ncbi:DUF1697 domain-containing protein [Sphingomonas sp. NSE70-1]|uniref:DUF1697 domain-containing protein n=1 Tax=Sphingomonas caseinilyticus TaxID=2908205 RepID=A0ABT0RW41_9SPHN|nr:DUF1697 domain-containing protein [Sphingomonas caseinilyticus]MCL6699202.1 DUF1697 domain-containing protein [Sphingomonas caseinilyticus]